MSRRTPTSGGSTDPVIEAREWLVAAGRSLAAERTVWAIAVAALVLDVGSTAYGIGLGYAESNPFVRVLLAHHGVVGLFVAKSVGLVAAFAARGFLPERYRPLIPAALAAPWLVGATINVVLLTGA